jgi:hypothetical protein
MRTTLPIGLALLLPLALACASSRVIEREDATPTAERVVRSGHSTQAHPQTLAEVRRILLEHATQE